MLVPARTSVSSPANNILVAGRGFTSMPQTLNFPSKTTRILQCPRRGKKNKGAQQKQRKLKLEVTNRLARRIKGFQLNPPSHSQRMQIAQCNNGRELKCATAPYT
ncbi:hypothetical protein N7G274_005758 [Stereocaulon virgatum]|uniref:Uncharacterized protein n=1 Tax=Stereocaulon virgatum TaxID=373712 RepID=A0ABR4A8Z8_9LECA